MVITPKALPIRITESLARIASLETRIAASTGESRTALMGSLYTQRAILDLLEKTHLRSIAPTAELADRFLTARARFSGVAPVRLAAERQLAEGADFETVTEWLEGLAREVDAFEASMNL